jgi:AAHS family 4-hydroxybenzoate transporter-like MFS transporter
MENPARSVWLGSLDVTEIIDRRPLSPLGLRVAILCGLAMVLDGFDIQVITFVAPVLTEALGVSRSMLGPVFSIGLLGTTLGALIFGTLADRIGRKPLMLTCILVFAVCSLGTITATGIASLMAWRLLGGLALGA